MTAKALMCLEKPSNMDKSLNVIFELIRIRECPIWMVNNRTGEKRLKTHLIIKRDLNVLQAVRCILINNIELKFYG